MSRPFLYFDVHIKKKTFKIKFKSFYRRTVKVSLPMEKNWEEAPQEEKKVSIMSRQIFYF